MVEERRGRRRFWWTWLPGGFETGVMGRNTTTR
jgi:hypothetical protein